MLLALSTVPAGAQQQQPPGCFKVEMSHSTQGNPQGAQLLDRCTGKTWLLLCIRNARCRMASTPGRNWVVLDVAARHRMVVRTESLRIPNRHDTGSTSPRSLDELA